VAAISGQSCELTFSTNAGTRNFNFGTIRDFNNNIRTLSPTGSILAATPDAWFLFDIVFDLPALSVTGTVNGSPITARTISTGVGAQPNFFLVRQASFCSGNTGLSILHEGVQVEFLELYTTRNGGSEILRQRVGESAAEVNAHPWKLTTGAGSGSAV
jgi:hypothetical protein